MAGSYIHAVNDEGQLRNTSNMTIATETQGDAYETVEEMFGMIWWLANEVAGHRAASTSAEVVEQARVDWKAGIALSPGCEPED